MRECLDLGEHGGKVDDVGLPELGGEAPGDILAEKRVTDLMPRGGCIRGRAGWLDTVGFGAMFRKDRQQAAVVAADIQHLLAAEIAVSCEPGSDQTPHAVEYIADLACAVLVDLRKQVLFLNLRHL